MVDRPRYKDPAQWPPPRRVFLWQKVRRALPVLLGMILAGALAWLIAHPPQRPAPSPTQVAKHDERRPAGEAFGGPTPGRGGASDTASVIRAAQARLDEQLLQRFAARRALEELKMRRQLGIVTEQGRKLGTPGVIPVPLWDCEDWESWRRFVDGTATSSPVSETRKGDDPCQQLRDVGAGSATGEHRP